jgi:hypothetical protein
MGKLNRREQYHLSDTHLLSIMANIFGTDIAAEKMGKLGFRLTDAQIAAERVRQDTRLADFLESLETEESRG